VEQLPNLLQKCSHQRKQGDNTFMNDPTKLPAGDPSAAAPKLPISAILAIGMGLIAAIAGAYFATQATPRADSKPITNQSANLGEHFFTGQWPDANEKKQSFADWRGDIVVINFWATWCPPCIKEMPDISKMATELAPKKIRFVGIGIDSGTNIRQFLAKSPVSYPISVVGLSGSDLARSFGNDKGMMPFTIVLNKRGEALARITGAIEPDELKAILLAEAAKQP
jgi:thiol-disulfide isomerase/thioredoxin